MIIRKKNLLYRLSVAPGPAPEPPEVPNFITIEKSYLLDYQITTGQELGIADITYTVEWNYFNGKRGWARTIGYWGGNDFGDNNHKWFLGCFRGGSLNPGTQFGTSGDRTLTIDNYTVWNTNFLNKRNLWKFGNGLLYVYSTSGNWEEGTEIGYNTGGNSPWTNIIGKNISVSNNLKGASSWDLPYNFHGLRIYNNSTDLNLVAEYVPAQVGGVSGILNTMTQYFVS